MSGVSLSGRVRYQEARQRDEQVYPNVYSGFENPFLDAERRMLSRSLFNTFYSLSRLGTDNSVAARIETGAFTHHVLAGIDYRRDRVTGGSASAEIGPIDIYAPVYTGVPALTYEPIGRQVTSQIGLYLQNQVRYADRATLMLGLRRDRTKSTTEGSPAQTDQVTSFRAGAIAPVAQGLSPYFNYSESFQPIIGVSAAGDPFRPERGIQYEAGFKWEPIAGSLVTLSAFHIRGTNRLVNDPDDPNNLLQIGEVESRGVEAEAGLELPGGSDIVGSYSYIDAEISQSTEPLEVGSPIIGVPKHLASFWSVTQWTLLDQASLRIGGGVRYTGATVQAIAAPPEVLRQRTPSFTLFDALIELGWRRWLLSINATNLSDERYYALCGYYADCAVGLRRNVVGTLGYRFGRAR